MPTYTLKGKITDAALGTPVPNALVKIVAGSGANFGKSAVTNANGRYKITGVTPERADSSGADAARPI